MENAVQAQQRALDLYAIRAYSDVFLPGIYVIAWFLQQQNGPGSMQAFFVGLN